MPELTSTPAQDLAALDRVTVIASDAGLMTSGLAVLLERLRIPTAVEHDRRLALGRAYTRERGIVSECDAEDYLSCAATILTAVASVGAEIVWPSPDSAEVADRPSPGDSAPGIDTAVTEGEWPFPFPPGTYTMTSSHEGDGDAVITDDGRLLVQQDAVGNSEARWLDLTDIYNGGTSWRFAKHEPMFRASEAVTAEPAAREKILAEVAASTKSARADFAHPRGIRDEAVDLARTPDGDPFGDPVPSRANMVAAAALLVLAVERLDGAR